MFLRAAAALVALAAIASATTPVDRKMPEMSCPDYDVKLSVSKTTVKPGQKIKATCTINFHQWGCDDAYFYIYNDGLDFYTPKIAPKIKGSSTKYNYNDDDTVDDSIYWVFPETSADAYLAAKKGYKATVSYQIPKDAESEDCYYLSCGVYTDSEGECENYDEVDVTVA